MAEAKKQKDELHGLVELNLHGTTYVMQCEDAMEVFTRLQGATVLDYTYQDNVRKNYMSATKQHNLYIRPLDRNVYIEAVVNGEMP